MSNATFELAHGNPAHDNFRNGAARDLLPGELDFNVTTGFVTIADRGAKLGKEYAGIVQDGAAVIKVKNRRTTRPERPRSRRILEPRFTSTAPLLPVPLMPPRTRM